MENEFILTLPEEIRGNEFLKDIADAPTLAKKYIEKASAKPDVFSALPDDVKNDPAFSKYKTSEDFVKGIKEQAALIGRKVIFDKDKNPVFVPTATSTPEEKAAYKKAMGIPDKTDGYKLSKVEGLHPKVLENEGLKNFLLQTALELDLTPAQVDGLNSRYGKFFSQAITDEEAAFTKTTEAATNALIAEWGGKDNYEKNVAAIEKVIGDTDPQMLVAMGDLRSNPNFLKGLAKLAGKLSPEAVGNLGAGGGAGTAKEEAIKWCNAEREKMKADPKHPYFNPGHPDHAKFLKEYNAKFAIANG